MQSQRAMVQVFEQHGVVAEEQESSEPIERAEGNDMKRRKGGNHQEVEDRCGQNTKEAPGVEAFHADAPRPRLLIKQPGADQESADGKEQLDAHLTNVGENLQQGPKNGNRTP